QLPVPPVPLGFSERTLQRLDRARSVAERPRARFVRWATAAALVAAATIFWIERERFVPSSHRSEEIATRDGADREATGDAGERRKYGEANPPAGRTDAPAWKQAPVAKEMPGHDESEREQAKGGQAPPPPAAAAPPGEPPGAGGHRAEDFDVAK